MTTLPGGLSATALDPIIAALAPLIAEAQRESIRKTVGELRQAIFRTATVIDFDARHGTAEVRVDGDPRDAISTAIAVGLVPPPGSRCLVVFVPPSGFYVLGSLGAIRVVIAETDDVSLTSDDHPFQIGLSEGKNLAMDRDEIQCREAGTYSILRLQNQGGNTRFWNTAQIGRADSGLDTAGFGHVAMFTPEGTGFRQQSTGATILNAPSGTTVQFRIDGLDPVNMIVGNAAAGFALVGFPKDLPTAGLTRQVHSAPTGNHQLFVTTSRRADKTDIVDFRDVHPPAVEMVDRLRLRAYTRLNVLPDHQGPLPHEIGFIAEEVDEVLGVGIRDNSGEVCDYDRDAVARLTTGAVQELTARVRTLEAKVADLEARLAG